MAVLPSVSSCESASIATLSATVLDALASPPLLREDCSILRSTFASASNPAPVVDSPRLMPPAS